MILNTESFGQFNPELVIQSGHGATIKDFEINQSETYMVSVDANQTCIVWDIQSGYQINRVKGIEQAGFYNDSLLILLDMDERIDLRSIYQEDNILNFELPPIRSFKILDHEDVLFIGKGLHRLKKREVSDLSFNVSSNALASEILNGEFVIRTGDSLVQFSSKTNSAFLVSKRFKNKVINDFHVAQGRIYAKAKKSLWSIPLHEEKSVHYNSSSFSISFTDLGGKNNLALLNSSGAIYVFDIKFKTKFSLYLGEKFPASLRMIHDEKIVLVSLGENIVMIDLITGNVLKTYSGKTSIISASVFSSDQNGLFVALQNGLIRYVPLNPLQEGFNMKIPRKGEVGERDWNSTVLNISEAEGKVKLDVAYYKLSRTSKVKRVTLTNFYWDLKSGKYTVDEVDSKSYPKKKRLSLKEFRDSMKTMGLIHNDKYALDLYNDDQSLTLETKEGNQIRMILFGEEGKIFQRDRYYFSSKNLSQYISFKINKKIYPFEQFDHYLNNPFEVFKGTGLLKAKELDLFEKAYKSRLKNLKAPPLDELNLGRLPKLEVLRERINYTDSSKYTLNLKMEGYYNLKSLHVLINDVPLDGKSGIILDGRMLEKELELELSYGLNNIKVYLRDEQGMISNVEQFSIYSGKKTDQSLYVISVGVSNYQDENFKLDYAVKDARDFAGLFSKNKLYENVQVRTIEDPVKDDFLAKIRLVVAEAKTDDIILFYYAGHGVLDADYNYYLCPSDMDFMRPKESGIAFSDVEFELSTHSTRKRIIFLDACHSGEIDKDEIVNMENSEELSDEITFRSSGSDIKVGLEGVSYLEMSKMLFQDTRENYGNMIISSASGVEFAVEGSKWSNGLFTYCLKEGILSSKADLNGDHNIYLDELVTYVSTAVIDYSKGRQHPRVRIEIQGLNPQLK